MTKKATTSKSVPKTKPKKRPEFNQYIDKAYTICTFISCSVCKQYSYLTLFDLDKLGYEIPCEVFYHPDAIHPTSFQQLTSCLTQELEKKLETQGWAFIRPGGGGGKYKPICCKCLHTFPPVEDPALLTRLERLANGEDSLLDDESILDPEGLVN